MTLPGGVGQQFQEFDKPMGSGKRFACCIDQR
jgi:hypothetical protein